MRSRMRIRNHPIHPMLVVFPIALWVFSLVADLIYVFGTQDVFWKAVAFYTMLGGVVGALAAAIPGFLDYLALTDRTVKRIALSHMVLNLVVVALYIFNLGLRLNAPETTGGLDVVLSAIGIVLLTISGWLGGHLVYVHRVGVLEAGEPRDVGRKDRAA